MKREEVKGIIPGITDEQLTQIMDLHSADIERHKQQVTTLTTERDAARTQLGEANKKLEGYDPEWKQKAEQARQQAERQVLDLRSRYAESNAAAALKFSSASARKAFWQIWPRRSCPCRRTALCWALTTTSNRTCRPTRMPLPPKDIRM